jgi:cytochrome c oxidase subunit 1
MHFLGLAGMPRRIPDYPLQFTELNSIASIGAFMFGLGQLIFLYNIVMSIRSGQPAPHKPWEGGNTLEWEIPTPAPYHSFAEAPTLEVGENGVIHAVKGGAHH